MASFTIPSGIPPHDPDVKALLRISQVYDVPIAMGRASSDYFVTSPYFASEYDHEPRIVDSRTK